MAPDKNAKNEERDKLYALAFSERLNKFHDLEILDAYGQAFAMDPDEVEQKNFNTVMAFAWKWKEQNEFNRRLELVRKLYKPDDNKS